MPFLYLAGARGTLGLLVLNMKPIQMVSPHTTQGRKQIIIAGAGRVEKAE
jgi:hypothetical protein